MDTKSENAESKSEDKESEFVYNPMTDEEIKQFVISLFKGEVFTDAHVQRKEDIPMIFPALILADKKLIEKLVKNQPGMIYEHMREACPMSVNGMPVFFSFHLVSKEDTKKINEQYQRLKKTMDLF